MIEEILPAIYRIEIPLPGNPLKAVNSYIIKDNGRNLIIDTGLNRDECMVAMEMGLVELKVRLKETDYFITHLHADHFGLVSRLATPEARVYFNRPDAEAHARGGVWDRMREHALLHGFPGEEMESALHRHPGYRYGSNLDMNLTLLQGGDTLTVGPYTLRCIETPGHTRGHMCLYEPEHKFLFSGDHILGDITPNIQSWSDDVHPLRNYLASLDKIARLEVDLVLPGHRGIFRDCRGRIRTLKHHHRVRADEILVILKQGPQSAYRVASRMKWDIECDSWKDFPMAQKWFATGEALAHLQYLEEVGILTKCLHDGKLIYALNESYP